LLPYAQAWDGLSQDVPFRTWPWLSGWWRHYGGQAMRESPSLELFVLGVLDKADRLIGVAPWYLDATTWQGRVVRFLGTGEICSEYLSVPAAPGMEDVVTAALADWLSAARGTDAWDLLELTSISADDAVMTGLAERLRARGNLVHQRPGASCWRIELPDTWEKYLATVSKQHRSRLRKIERQLLESGRAVIHWVRGSEDLPQAQQVLIELHQARRQFLGEPGCFSSRQFTAFHGQAMQDLLDRGQLGLFWIELDGKPFVADYMFHVGKNIYQYQCGLDPTRLDEAPGRLGNLVCLKFAIENGYRTFDFLRGDEPYKGHFRAQPYACLEIRAVPARLTCRLRHGIWRAGAAAKPWLAARLKPASRSGALPNGSPSKRPVATEDAENLAKLAQ
jgi:CelD/BcsL family acetyltransferase involved in cellulose biosynthesis